VCQWQLQGMELFYRCYDTTLPPGGSTLGVFGGSAGITNQGLFWINNGSISTTSAATLVTGFHDVPNNIDYTLPLVEGLANGEL
jgi:hypothetical protein